MCDIRAAVLRHSVATHQNHDLALARATPSNLAPYYRDATRRRHAADAQRHLKCATTLAAGRRTRNTAFESLTAPPAISFGIWTDLQQQPVERER